MLGPEQTVAAVLWVAWTWVLDRFDIAPLLFISSPVKRCGKTTFLRVLSAMVARPLLRTLSPAALFRVVEECKPTLLIDEGDLLIKTSEEWRLLLNAGHTKDSAGVIRCVGDDHQPRQFSTWCPKAVAAIGRLPATLEDRSIIITLQRKKPQDNVKRLDYLALQAIKPLTQKFMRWKLDLEAQHNGPWKMPSAPSALDDRAADCWGPLLALADLAGGDWPERARRAAIAISGGKEEAEMGALLLKDCVEVFGAAERLSTSELIERLCRLELAPWRTFCRGRPITPRRLASMLKEFGISPHKWETSNGYLREDFLPIVERYFPPGGSNLHSSSLEHNSLQDNDLEPGTLLEDGTLFL